MIGPISICIGHPYLEAQRIDKSKPENLADWLLDTDLSLTTLLLPMPNGKKFAPATNWHKSLDAEQVHYYRKNMNRWKHGNIPCILSPSDSCKFKERIFPRHNPYF